jgi:small multidrug resistance pump
MVYLYLVVAIAAEVVGTMALKASEGFSKLAPSLLVVAGYGLSFYLFSLVIKSMAVGIAYAIWAGLGILLVTVAGAVLYRQVPDVPAVVGTLLIVAGVVVIQLFSRTVTF